MLHKILLFSFLILIAFSPVSANQVSPVPENPVSLLPVDSLPKGIDLHGEPRNYSNENLYEYLNGGALLYMEYGFVSLTVGTYMLDQKEYTVEIYEMKDAPAAHGIYSLLQPEDAEDVAIGNHSSLKGYSFMFWEGAFFVVISSKNTNLYTEPALVKLAVAIEEKLSGVGEFAKLNRVFLNNTTFPVSEKYFRGPIGLSHVYAFDAADIFSFQEAVYADFGEYEMFVLKYQNEKDASLYFTSSRHVLVANPKYRTVVDNPGYYTLNEKGVDELTFQLYTNYIIVCRYATDNAITADAIQQVKSKLSVVKKSIN